MGVAAHHGLEKHGLYLLGNGRSQVVHFDHATAAAVHTGGHGDGRVRLAVTHGIGDEVAHQLRQTIRIGCALAAALMAVDQLASRIGQGQFLHHLRDRGAQVHRLRADSDAFAHARLREIKQIGDQAVGPFRRARDPAQHAKLIGRGLAARQQGRAHEDRR